MVSGMNQKMIYIFAFCLLLAGLGYLVFTSVQKESMYFLDVSEALAKQPHKVQKARLFGQVAPDGVWEEESSGQAAFLLTDKEEPDKQIRVEYKGFPPDSVGPGTEVIVEGSMKEQGDVFSAHTLMTQCPSKYEGEMQ